MRFHGLLFGLLALAALPAGAQNVVTVAGTAGTNNNSPAGAAYSSWTQTGTFTNVTIQVTIQSCYGTANGEAYLNLNGTAPGNQLYANPVTVGTTGYDGVTVATVNAFPTIPSLGPGTYYLTVAPLSGVECGMFWTNTLAPTVTTGTGVSVPTIYSGSELSVAQIGYPPSYNSFSSGYYFLFTVTGTPSGVTPVPALTPGAVIAMGLLLLASGLYLMWPRRARTSA